MIKKRFLYLYLFLFLIVAIGECYYYFKVQQLHQEESKNEIKNDDENLYEKPKEDLAKYLVDIFTPYSKDNLKLVLRKDSDTLFYYVIDGLKNKEVEAKVNNMIKEEITSLKEKYPGKVVTGYIYSNFENTLSIVFEAFSSKTISDFEREVANEDR